MKEALVHYVCAPDEGNLPPISWRTLSCWAEMTWMDKRSPIGRSSPKVYPNLSLCVSTPFLSR